MILYIPSLGTQITLAAQWTFTLVNEPRNDSLRNLLGILIPEPNWRATRAPDPIKITLPIGTVLSIDRYYIRQNNESHDSITFNLVSHPDFPPTQKTKLARFWVHLRDANYMRIEEIVS